MDISFQLYSARNFTPWDKVLERLSALGYTQVEGFRGNYADAAGFREMLDKNGLKMPSGHFFPMEQFEEDFAGAIRAAKALGIEQLYCPALPPEGRPAHVDGWKSVAHRLEEIGKKVRGEGLRFGWHNHDFEFNALADGTLPMDVLLEEAPSIEWEIDVAWVVRGGQDPLAWINRFANRITGAHVKDLAPEGECADEDGWADVGHGTMDWKELTAALRKIGVKIFVMEHDNPSDFERFASRSIEAFRTF